MQANSQSLPAAAFFAASLLLAFHADGSLSSVLRAETRVPVALPLEPKPTDARTRSRNIDEQIAIAATEHGVRRELIRAVIEIESRFDPFAISGRGACGLMQLMPATAQRFGVVDCHDVRQNIHGGTRLLKALLIRYDGDISLAMAAYNAGRPSPRDSALPPDARVCPQCRAAPRRRACIARRGLLASRAGRPRLVK